MTNNSHNSDAQPANNSSFRDQQARTTAELLNELQTHQIELEMQNDELRRSQISLEESRDRYVDFYDFAPAGYLTLSREALITDINLTGATLLGKDRSQLINRRFSACISPNDRDSWHRHFMEVLRKDSKLFCELSIQRSDGTSIYIHLDSLRLIKNEKYPIVRIAITDITDRKRAELELIYFNRHLTHEVSKRTAELASLTAHIQQLAEVEKANLARELHDELGSILVGINMEVGRLRGKISDPDILHNLADIKELLTDAARVKRGVINQLYPTILDNLGFIAAVEWLLNEFKKRSSFIIEFHKPESDFKMEQPYALAAYRITQECLTNIAKHAEADNVQIEARVRGGFLDLTIHDNGKGLPETKTSGGHGIFGMAERARFLGGSLDFGSEFNQGTTVHLFMPLEAGKKENKKRVLVVDDHAIVRDAIRQLLERETEDFSVEGEAADGSAAIRMALEGAWDIMLLDISLPHKDGLQVLQELKIAKPDLPIIMLSSHAEDEYGDIALSKGAACYIEKGETHKLIEAMRRATLGLSSMTA
jgi:PAS domain S-box-containing protein